MNILNQWEFQEPIDWRYLWYSTSFLGSWNSHWISPVFFDVGYTTFTKSGKVIWIILWFWRICDNLPCLSDLFFPWRALSWDDCFILPDRLSASLLWPTPIDWWDPHHCLSHHHWWRFLGPFTSVKAPSAVWPFHYLYNVGPPRNR